MSCVITGNAEIVSEIGEERRRSVEGIGGGGGEVKRVFCGERGRRGGGSGGGGRGEDFVVGEVEKVVDTKQVR
uniref:Uncharacterized protein n=1 Tax=Noccaea caerulescens TaxID=107243 RepID=A0A1J3D3E4_NOCCA